MKTKTTLLMDDTTHSLPHGRRLVSKNPTQIHDLTQREHISGTQLQYFLVQSHRRGVTTESGHEQVVQGLQVQSFAQRQLCVIVLVSDGGPGHGFHLNGGHTRGTGFGLCQQRVHMPQVRHTGLDQDGGHRHHGQHGCRFRNIIVIIIGSGGFHGNIIIIPHGRVAQGFGPLQRHGMGRLHGQTTLLAPTNAGPTLGDNAQQETIERRHGPWDYHIRILLLVQSEKRDGFAKEIRLDLATVTERFIGGTKVAASFVRFLVLFTIIIIIIT